VKLVLATQRFAGLMHILLVTCLQMRPFLVQSRRHILQALRFLLPRLQKLATDLEHGTSHQLGPRTQLRRQMDKHSANLLKIVQADLTQSFNRLRANAGEPVQFPDRNACQALVEGFL